MRDNLKQMIAVTGRISGRDMGSTIKQITGILNKPGFLPTDVYYIMGGLYQQQRIAFKGLIAVFMSAVVLVFVLLLFLYESFRAALAMMITTLFSLAAVFIGLWVTRTELNITAIMGMTMIVGIVTEVMIFYYSEFIELTEEKDLHTRLILAGKNRMRPITMTTLATILALMPLALGIGEGSTMLQPLAIAIISGLIIQLPLVLIIQPVLLMFFRKV
jgi:multidrug efflux pump subunit AcrB